MITKVSSYRLRSIKWLPDSDVFVCGCFGGYMYLFSTNGQELSRYRFKEGYQDVYGLTIVDSKRFVVAVSSYKALNTYRMHAFTFHEDKLHLDWYTQLF
jgi:hypothetical protein